MITNAQIVARDVSPAQYDVETEQRGSPKLVVRSHLLNEILRNAQRWVRGYESPDSKSKKFGSLLDCLLLTPFQYPKRYASTPATYTNKKGEKSKWRNDMRIEEVAQWHEDHAGLEIVDMETNASVHAAIKRLREDALIVDLIDSSKHSVMVTADWQDVPTGLTVPMKALIDIEPPTDHPVFGNSLWDLKTTQNASPRSFSRDAQKYGYAVQAAFYVDLWNAASNAKDSRSDFGHVVLENFPPYEFRSPPPLLTQRFLGVGKLLYQRGLSIYCKALRSGKWPGYDGTAKAWPLTDCDDWYATAEQIYEDAEEDEEPESTPTEETEVIP